MTLKNAKAKRFSLKRFSLRTFLVVFLLLGCGLGALSQLVIIPGNAQLRIQAKSGHRPELISNSSRQYSSVVWISHKTEAETPWFTWLIRNWVHIEYGHHMNTARFSGTLIDDVGLAKDFAISSGVEKVSFEADQIAPDFASYFFQTRGIRELTLRLTPDQSPEFNEFVRSLTQAKSLELLTFEQGFLGEADALEIAKLANLKTLYLDASTPEALARVADCKSLEQLAIRTLHSNAQDFRAPHETEATFAERSRRSMQAFLRSMVKSPNLKSLFIGGTLGLAPEDLRDFCVHSGIKNLSLSDPGWAPECLAEIARLPRLESLRIEDLHLKDEHLAMLYKAEGLKSLTIGPMVSQQAIDRLRVELPNCKVARYGSSFW